MAKRPPRAMRPTLNSTGRYQFRQGHREKVIASVLYAIVLRCLTVGSVITGHAQQSWHDTDNLFKSPKLTCASAATARPNVREMCTIDGAYSAWPQPPIVLPQPRRTRRNVPRNSANSCRNRALLSVMSCRLKTPLTPGGKINWELDCKFFLAPLTMTGCVQCNITRSDGRQTSWGSCVCVGY